MSIMPSPLARIKRALPALALAAALLCSASIGATAADDLDSPPPLGAMDVNVTSKKFEPPEDIKVVTKKEWSMATPVDAYYGMISSMLADNPHWQAEGTVRESREMVRRMAGGKTGVLLHKMLTTKISRIAVMQVIQKGDAAIVISLKEHKPTIHNKEVTYSSDVFGFEKRGDKWYFNPRRSTSYPGCHVVFLGNMRPPINHYYCLTQSEDGYFTLDSTIQHDEKFNKAMFGDDPSRYEADK